MVLLWGQQNKEQWGISCIFVAYVNKELRPVHQRKEEKTSRLLMIQTVCLALLFTWFCRSLPFHRAVLWFFLFVFFCFPVCSLALLSRVLPGRSCPGCRPPLQASSACQSRLSEALILHCSPTPVSINASKFSTLERKGLIIIPRCPSL